jgi:hypothetical protein
LHSPKPLVVFVDPPSWLDHMPVAADHHLRNPGIETLRVWLPKYGSLIWERYFLGDGIKH